MKDSREHDSEFKQTLEDIKHLLAEILKWSRFQAIRQQRNLFVALLQKDSEKTIYEKSDGRDSRELAALAGVSHQTVVNYWRRWAFQGLVEPVRARGGKRYRKILSLSELGIEAPRSRLSRPKKQLRRDLDE